MNFEILPPAMPNNVIIRDTDTNERSAKPVADLTEAEAGEYADQLKDAFLAHWTAKQP